MTRAIIVALGALGALGACKSPAPAPKITPAPVATIPAPVFEVPPPHEKIVSVGRGLGHACVVRASGAVDCWGQPIGGPPDPAPRRIPGVDDAVSIAPLADCVVRKSGETACLAGTHLAFVASPLPTVTRDDAMIATMTALLPPIRKLVPAGGGGDRACALLESGELRCFALSGDRKSIAAADAYDTPTTIPPVMGVTDFVVATINPLRVEALVGGKVVVATTDTVTTLPSLTDAVLLVPGCALRAQGSVVCWGANISGALGMPTTIGRRLRPPGPVAGAADVASLALGGKDSWALTHAGKILHWGSTAEAWATAVAPPAGLGTITSLVATRLGSGCVLDERGAVWCWTSIDRAWKPVHSGGIRAIAAESSTVLALGADNTVTRTRVDHEYDDKTEQPAPLPAKAVALAANRYNPCALTESGASVCGDAWAPLGGANHADRLLIAGFHACELKAGKLTCWWTGVLGGENKPVPDLSVIEGVSDVALGNERVCGVRAGGRLRCWPYREWQDPIDLFASGVIDVELGQGSALEPETGVHGCAIMSDRTVQCWGSNLFGELGDGSVRESAVPIGVPNL